MDKFTHERQLRGLGYGNICGVDEVGRGPLAGPVVCAAVIMPEDDPIAGVDDSKLLTAKRRGELSEIILKTAVACSIAAVEPQTVDEINILQATRLCMKRAVEGLATPPDYVITDGNMRLDISLPQKSIVKGDRLSYTIGCASIVAKVYRDRLMAEYDGVYPGYGFARNKGYGTAAHIAALKALGPCPIHRKTFIKKFI